MTIAFNNTVYQPGFFGTDDGGAKNSVKLDDTYPFPVSLSGTITGPGGTVTITFDPGGTSQYANQTMTLTATQYDNSNMIEFTGGTPPGQDANPSGYRYIFSNTMMYGSDSPNRTTFTADPNDSTLSDYQPVCFASGTRIRVRRDGVDCDAAVEDLQVGDQAVTASGMLRPVTWIGHRTMDCGRHPRPSEIMPVRIAAHAFGENRPARDLVVSPGHAICVEAMGEILVPASALVDGGAVVQIGVARVTYWHVELEAHDILLAENMPAESYLEMGNRHFFAEAEVVTLHTQPDAPVATHADFCRPFVADGPLLEVVKARLATRSAEQVVFRIDKRAAA